MRAGSDAIPTTVTAGSLKHGHLIGRLLLDEFVRAYGDSEAISLIAPVRVAFIKRYHGSLGRHQSSAVVSSFPWETRATTRR